MKSLPTRIAASSSLQNRREGLTPKRLKAFEGDISETICLEVTISKKVWFITYIYRPPYNNNKDIFSVNFQIPWVSQQGNMRTFSLLMA